MVFDFSFVLVVATAVTGLIWAADARYFRPRRLRPRGAGGRAAVAEPVVVEYARSFFPIILVVLLIRSFLFEPFRIPSDSMMPTLLDGDFIFVNKFTYGLRLPVLNTKIVALGEPHRGDVVVFRLPSDPSTNYIKRLVGLPGDHIVVRDKRVYVNGALQEVKLDGLFEPFNSTPLRPDRRRAPGRRRAPHALHRRAPVGRLRRHRAGRALSSSWATIATTAATAGSRKWVSCPPTT